MAIGRPRTRLKRKLLQRNPRAVEPDFLRRTAGLYQRVDQRLRTRQHQVHAPEHFQERPPVGRLIEFHQHVRAVKRHDGWPTPARFAQQRQKPDARVAEENVQQRRLVFVQTRAQTMRFTPAQEDGLPERLPINDPPQPTQRPRRNLDDITEGKRRRVLPFAGEHHRMKTPDGGQLPVDVLHLRLEKSGAITSDYPATVHAATRTRTQTTSTPADVGTDRPRRDGLRRGHRRTRRGRRD